MLAKYVKNAKILTILCFKAINNIDIKEDKWYNPIRLKIQAKIGDIKSCL